MGFSSPLIEAIFQCDFSVAASILLAKPLDAQVVDGSGWTALHWACVQASCPLELIKSLTLAWPRALLLKDRFGCTPLHDACLHNRSDIVNYILTCGFQAESVRNNNGWTPLQHLCLYYRDQMQNFEAMSQEQQAQYVDAMSMIMGECLTALWCNATLLISSTLANGLAAYQERHQDFSILHAACSLGQECPIELIRVIVKVSPSFLTEVDGGGNLPLHIACAAVTRTGTEVVYSSNDNDMPQCQVLEFLCQEQPLCTRQYNALGKLPLHMAIEGRRSMENGVNILLKIFPESVGAKERISRLLPFMLAASSGNTTLSFQLLQMRPELEQFSLKKEQEAPQQQAVDGDINTRKRQCASWSPYSTELERIRGPVPEIDAAFSLMHPHGDHAHSTKRYKLLCGI
jgi:ankyrin repeat protein